MKQLLSVIKERLVGFGRGVIQDEHIVLRLFALGLAVLLWFLAVGGERYSPLERQVILPVQAINVPNEMALLSDLGDVTVAVRGLGPLLYNSGRGLEAYVDLSGAAAGTRTARVQVNTPPGTSITGMTPAVMAVTLEPWVEREFTVSVALVGAPAGYEPGRFATEPARALVRAPRSAMDRIVRLAAYVEVQDGVEERQYPLRVLDSNWQDVTPAEIQPRTVELRRQ